jgi:hypothetical protein
MQYPEALEELEHLGHWEEANEELHPLLAADCRTRNSELIPR